MHANSKNLPAHFAYISCREQFFHYWEHPNCPVCNQPIYTVSVCYYLQCNLRVQIEKDLHQNRLLHVFFECIKPLTSCPLCSHPKAPDDPLELKTNLCRKTLRTPLKMGNSQSTNEHAKTVTK